MGGSGPKIRGGAIVALALSLGATLAEAKSEACLGTGKPMVVIDDTVIALVNPEYVENQLRTAWCYPVYDRPGLLFDYTGIEFGFFNYLGPVFAHQGAYVDISPLSFLEFKAAAAAVDIWPLPLDGAGYFSLPGYTLHYKDTDLPQANAHNGFGANLTFTAAIRGAVPLFGEHSLLFANAFSVDYWYMPGSSTGYYWNPRRDAALKTSDVVLNNSATVLLEFSASSRVKVHVGLDDDFNYVPASGYRSNVLGVMVSVPIRRSGSLRDIEPFFRAGAYTNHAYREGFQAFFGISFAWGVHMDGSPPVL